MLASELISIRSNQLGKWAAGQSNAIKGLELRKFVCQADHFKTSKDNLTAAVCLHFDLMIPHKYQVWSAPMMMAVHSSGMHLPNGEEFRSGVHFFVKTLTGQYQKLRDFRVFVGAPGGELDTQTDTWVAYWIQRCLKDSSVKKIFACKKLISEDMDEAVGDISADL